MRSSDKGRSAFDIGSLEARVYGAAYHLQRTKEANAVTVRDVCDFLNTRERLLKQEDNNRWAYTTIMTVMNNLTNKGLLDQNRLTGGAYLYHATGSPRALWDEARTTLWDYLYYAGERMP